MRPIIGMVARVMYPGGTHKLVVNEEYRMAIIKYGGIPISILPSVSIDVGDVKVSLQNELTELEKEMLIRSISLCDGILMPGGFKINKFDRFICEYAISNNIPLFGICLGMQIMSNYKRDIIWNEKNDSFINHLKEGRELVHSVNVKKDSILYSIVKKDNFLVNSRHSYHACNNDNFESVAFSEDGYIEAIEIPNLKFCIGVQWHPEDMDDDTSKNLFEKFIECSSSNSVR